MHSFPQFTRSTLWREFALVGAIIFEGNFMVRREIVRGKFSSGATVRGAMIFGGNWSSGAMILGSNDTFLTTYLFL